LESDLQALIGFALRPEVLERYGLFLYRWPATDCESDVAPTISNCSTPAISFYAQEEKKSVVAPVIQKEG
jgi:hypothetical protein